MQWHAWFFSISKHRFKKLYISVAKIYFIWGF